MPTFSYAQAAKGASETPAPAKPVSTSTEKPDSKPIEQTSDVPESTSVAPETETSQEAEKTTPAAVEQDTEFTTVTSKTRSKATHSRTSSPSVRSTTTQAKEGDSSNTAANGSQEAPSEKQKAQADTKTEKSASTEKSDKSENAAEETKEKSGKSEKSEKSEKNAPPKELKAAPLPSVNIWHQRKEAQDAKAKVSPAPTSGSPASGKATEEPQQQDSSKASPKKKNSEGGQEGGKGGKKSDGGKGRDGVIPPPVEDASSWPTPEVAIGEDKKKAQEKTDKTDKTEKSPVMRTHGKDKWMPVSYVPTAVFNTPLPSAGNRGGRKPARGGRGGGGSSHAANAPAGDKVAPGQANNNSGAAGKQTSGDRGRNDTNTNRAASLPATPRRSTSTDANNSDSRNKAQAAERNSNNNSRGPRAEEAAAANAKPTNGGEANNTRPRDGKQFNRGNDARHGKGGHLSVDPQAAVRTNDRRFESGSKSAELNREAGNAGFQDFNRERGDQRGGRPNRGRGGPYSGFGNQNAQFGNVGNHFVPKNLGFNDRQRAQHGLGNGSQQGNRMPMRSPSLPASAGVYPVYPFPPEINTVYPYQAVAPAPMSAMPYPQYIEPYGIMPMLSMQLEYYFSVDNLCKDMFLRRRMDSEGFVPLSVIADFKRVKSLTEDFELVRHVVRHLQNVDYRVGEDGVDRVRPRERWDQWVLPQDQREHEDAAPAETPKTDENTHLSNHGDGSSNGSIHPASRQFIPASTMPGNAPKGLSSTAPEFMPSALNEVANRTD